ncbi:uncharacterized protein YjbI with pentapeptide repeats [Microvirga flocculans]|uniref:Uncharacterized protein YjbI with pentapeptide repeats n=1 Tax=Microvirga flocculans TaxID=217168 RepID=A0A7W6ICF9_9HYPH|nr:hypothetical protein [Microvirga flocculans]MBB4038606.1 uncharacterized protein YjbI with pentapeptide repeats [Microvirga flocculans]
MILSFLFLILSIVAVLRLGWGLVYGSNQDALEASRVFLPLAAAAVGLPLIIWRLVILNRQTRTAEEKTQIDRETHYTSIFSKSVEHLGATREHKETSESRGKSEPISRTVPNIEMRLGGLHSLARLAEESTRDSLKIQKMLSSYVRENSWYLRNGTRYASQPDGKYPFFSKWMFLNAQSTDEEKADKYLNEWRDRVDSKYDSFTEWAGTLPETRVDVAEAVSNLIALVTSQQIMTELYESLFVEQAFLSRRFKKFRFRRCVFVKCTFQLSDSDFNRLEDCVLVDCTFYINDNRIYFRSCDFYGGSINDASGGKIYFNAVNLVKLTSYATQSNTTLELLHSTLKDFRFFGDNITLTAKNSSLIDCNFDKAGFTAESTIERSNFIATSFKEADLSALTNIAAATLDEMIASPATLHPGGTRPSSWPPYDPDYVDDDIPF